MLNYANNHEMRFHARLIYALLGIDLLYPSFKDKWFSFVFRNHIVDKTNHERNQEVSSFVIVTLYKLDCLIASNYYHLQ